MKNLSFRGFVGRHASRVGFGTALLLVAGTISFAQAANTPGSTVFVPITPCRLVDTRSAPNTVGPRSTPLGALEIVTFNVRGSNGNCTIPSSATAVAANVTTLNGNADSNMRMYPAGSPTPNVSVNNWANGAGPTPNEVSVALSAGGQVSLRNQNGTVDVIIDVLGFYEPVTDADSDAAGYVAGSTIPVPLQGTFFDFQTLNMTLPGSGTVIVNATATVTNSRNGGVVASCFLQSTGATVTPLQPVTRNVAASTTESLALTGGFTFTTGGVKQLRLTCSGVIGGSAGDVSVTSPTITAQYAPRNIGS